MGVELGSLHYGHGVRQYVAEEGTTMWAHDGEDNKKPRIMRNEQLHDSYHSINIIRMNKLTRMSWTGHAARMLGETSCCRNMKERVYFQDPEVEG
jgi:hypothetical protein